MKTLTLNKLSAPCFDCPFRKDTHIKVKNIKELIDFLKDSGHINFCHRDTSDNTLCEGGELFSKKVKDNCVFDNELELIKSHDSSRHKDVRKAIFHEEN